MITADYPERMAVRKTEQEIATLFHAMLHGASACSLEGACLELEQAADLAADHMARP